MRIHIFATDVSALHFVGALKDTVEIGAIVVPENRLKHEKTLTLIEKAELRGLLVKRHYKQAGLDGIGDADAGISWLYSQIFTPEDLSKYPAGILNMHGGHIPSYRGANVLQWAIINGEENLGVTWHSLVEEVDAGPIWAESTIPLSPDATALDVRADMIAEGIRLFPDAWKRFDGKSTPLRAPNLDEGHVWPTRKPEDGRIQRDWTLVRLKNLVRALCHPWPPATIETPDGVMPVYSVMEVHVAGSVPYETSDHGKVYLVNEKGKSEK